jgi:hypothetical protein
MNVNDMFPSKYLKSDDLKGQRVRLQIMSVTIEEVADNEQKPVMRFIGKEKGMVLNKTNALALAVAFGEDTITWQGREIELLAMPVMFQGKQVMGLHTLPLGASVAPATPDYTRSARGDASSGPHDYPGATIIDPATGQPPEQSLADLEQDIAKAEQEAGVQF